MKKIVLIVLSLIIVSCKTDIKNPNSTVTVEEGTKVENTSSEAIKKTPEKVKKNPLIGYWVGFFERNDGNNYDEKAVNVGGGFEWNRQNKINISIDSIAKNLVFGHSVVAGNDRPFEGTIEKQGDDFHFKVKEPGDDKYDGEFNFIISNNQLFGTWEAYKNINIKKRKYTLDKKLFTYNPDTMLDETTMYVKWKTITQDIGNGNVEKWISSEFATATDLIYEMNASNTVLSKSDVENLKKGDLTIIRNAIYARHGYSFKSRPLRVFFDAQSWYIPVHTDIKSDFTDIEKQNIQLLLKYEKNASEYYDYFGRG